MYTCVMINGLEEDLGHLGSICGEQDQQRALHP